MNIGQRIDEVRIELGLSKTEIWKPCGLSSGIYSQWLNGMELKGENLIKVSKILSVNPQWLINGKGEKYLPKQKTNEIELEDNKDYPAVRRVSLKLSAGHTGFAIEYDIQDKTPLVFAKEWFVRNGYKPEKLLAVKVSGESMQPSLYDGDTVTINTAETKPVDGEVFAVNYEGELLIKRLVRDAGTWWISSDNSDQKRYPRKECSGDGCLILGRIVHKQSERI